MDTSTRRDLQWTIPFPNIFPKPKLFMVVIYEEMKICFSVKVFRSRRKIMEKNG